MMVELEWGGLKQKSSPCDIFNIFAHYFKLNLDETSFLCYEVELKVLGRKDKPRHDKNCSNLRFSITVL